jgi:hypothetical protein
MTRIRLIGLAVVAVFALSAVAASAASAHNFKAETAKVKVKASTTFGSPAVEHFQGFQASNAVVVCKKGTFEGEGTSGLETLEVHPVYTECSAVLEGTHTATVTTTGCNYLFHAAAPSTTEGWVDVVCTGTNKIKVEIAGLACNVEIGSQNGLKTIEYVNQGAGNARKVLVKANVTKIAYVSNCAALLKKEGTDAEYRAGELVGGVPKMGAGPAEALSAGFNELGEADGIWVE